MSFPSLKTVFSLAVFSLFAASAAANAQPQYLGQPGQPVGNAYAQPSAPQQQIYPNNYNTAPAQRPHPYQQQLRYQYDPRNVNDPRNQAGAPGVAESTLTLGTLQGIDVAIQGSHYRYEEPNVANLSGTKLGFQGIGTYNFSPGYFVQADIRYAFGYDRYNGSGTKPDVFDDIFDVRGLIGMDYVWENTYSLSPYIGFGYRYLYDDTRGTTSTGAHGYRRENELLYLPIGVRPRLRVDSEDRLALMLEYDYLLHGWQTSYLGDAGFGSPTITNQQSGGYGLRGELMWETNTWSAGPFFNYWNMESSSIKAATGPSCVTGCLEPKNRTTEYGLQAKYRFY